MKNNSKDKISSIILLSGGLDSLVALGAYKNEYNIELALTFDYGQKSAQREIESSKKICEYYSVRHEVIVLDWLKRITHTALVSGEDIPVENLGTEESAQKVWVPNRNGLFLNIAAAYADSFGYDYIIFGANKDEGSTFPDNTEEFRAGITKVFEKSTIKKPKVIAPLINCSKDDIVKIALKNNVPLESVRSCYSSDAIHCGVCESCSHLKKALINNNMRDLAEKLFKKL